MEDKLSKMINNGYVVLPRHKAAGPDSRFQSKADSLYTSLGIEIIDIYDHIFYMVRLPKGWKITEGPAEHYSDLVNDSGVSVGRIKYEYLDFNRVKYAVYYDIRSC